jgi:tetratricopeptide (TPR) repeat protein
MLKTSNKQTVRSLIVLSSSIDRLNARIRSLTIAARQSSFERDYQKVGLAADEILEVSPQSEPLARYFQALALNQQGKGVRDEAIKIYNELTSTNLSYIKSAAFLALGVESYRVGDYKEALYHIKQSSEYNFNAALTAVTCEALKAAIYSAKGEYENSFAIYHKALPRILAFGKVFPVFMNTELNNLAYDLNQLGRTQEASQIINQVVASPSAYKFPEWLETKQEIDDRLALNIKTFKASNFAIKEREFQRQRLKFTQNSSTPGKIEIFYSDELFASIILPSDDIMSRQIKSRFLEALNLISVKSCPPSCSVLKSFYGGKIIAINPIAHKNFDMVIKLIADLKDIQPRSEAVEHAG